ncbi:hypothetical protein WI42_05155 [Burkholderia ubonensis]|nr:hypothetical protein WI31_03840 [Burkholderia ubonensis]KUZ18034.1 hypothetical protein WI29_17435 [Burkholderia ubonensis]KUZ22797.1 hypothetical protein WI30_00850 [Burkholderia ubonensis]KUZ37724.1 hypothetical protein WI32_12825 [Burkholderia ubonensis]KUZ46607.1 hypothetical protein WI33_24065 [Burkholderia ubonensis]
MAAEMGLEQHRYCHAADRDAHEQCLVRMSTVACMAHHQDDQVHQQVHEAFDVAISDVTAKLVRPADWCDG